ncbi:MAG: LysE family translocator [Notoacmeibacter sp.]|nr:LysE family translocator [Notoacmeibacter sp.]MCC0032526.1 LysE family translocator [Brucellaceae bacterium]
MPSLPVDLTVLLAFGAASLVLLAIPGPTIIMVVSQTLAHGRRIALASVAGVGLGDLMAASLSTIGVGTVLAASAFAFNLIKWLGAAYLVWIGIKLWREPVRLPEVSQAPEQNRSRQWSVFRDAFLVTLFNPKGIVFFMAFVPQFIDPVRAFAPQAVTLILTFVLLGIVNAAAYVWLAGAARGVIRRPRVLRAAARTGAAFLIAAGFASALVKKAA